MILIGNQKGGCGKSTIACNFAGMLVTAGKDVILVDSDSQRSASRWIENRKIDHGDLPRINATQQIDCDVDDALVGFNERYRYVIVDAAGRDSRELRTALLVCDAIIMPFRPSSFDIETIPHMAGLIKSSRRVNPKLKAFALINSAPTNTQDKDSDSAKNVIRQFKDIILVNTVVYDRRIYRDSMAEGLTAMEMPDKSSSGVLAKIEMENLLSEIFKGMLDETA
jgi:chromosome partitioning protein